MIATPLTESNPTVTSVGGAGKNSYVPIGVNVWSARQYCLDGARLRVTFAILIPAVEVFVIRLSGPFEV